MPLTKIAPLHYQCPVGATADIKLVPHDENVIITPKNATYTGVNAKPDEAGVFHIPVPQKGAHALVIIYGATSDNADADVWGASGGALAKLDSFATDLSDLTVQLTLEGI